MDDPNPPSRCRFLRVSTGLVVLAVSGCLLAVLPHLIARVWTGDRTYIADGDELLYLAWSRDCVLHGRAQLIDAIHPVSGPMMHPRLIFVTPGLAGYWFGLGMTEIGILWRFLTGIGVALGFYIAVRPGLTRPGVAIAMAAFLLFDSGVSFGQVVQRGVEVVVSIWQGRSGFFATTPRLMPHLRVVTPGLAIPFYLVHLGLTLRARIKGDRWSIALAGVSFGLLFYVYFYFWTAAVLGLALAFVVDPGARRLYATIMVLGGAIGLPAVASSALTKAQAGTDWLLRTDKFLPIGRFQELEVPKLLMIEWILAGVWVLRGRRELAYLWCLTGAGMACRIHQVVTGLQIENFHWSQAAGLPFSVLLVLLIVPWLDVHARRGLRIGLPIVVAAQIGLGFWLREQEVVRSVETRLWMSVYHDYQSDALPLPDGAVVGGDEQFLALAAALSDVYPLSGRLVEYSSRASNQELDERLVLNLYLPGLDKADAEVLVNQPAGTLSREGDAIRSVETARIQRERRLRLVHEIWLDPRPALKKYGVTHLVLPAGQPPTGFLTGTARRVSEGARWGLWELD